LNAYELISALIEAGAAGVHLEDQLASAKKCGHMGGKVSYSGPLRMKAKWNKRHYLQKYKADYNFVMVVKQAGAAVHHVASLQKTYCLIST